MALSDTHEDAAPRLSRGGGRRRRMFAPVELNTLLLHLLRAGPRHGYDLAAEIEHRSGSAYLPSPGVLYPALQRLEFRGWTVTVEQPSRRRVYALTPEGAAQLEASASAVQIILQTLASARPAAASASGDLVRSAMARVEQALAAKAGALPPGFAAQIAARLDDLALSIRRRGGQAPPPEKENE